VLKGSSINADATSEYLGVGYIIGPQGAGIIFAGGVFSWLVIMPLIYFFGKELGHPVYPGQVPIAQMGPSDLWATYIKPMGAGAVAAAGLITLLKTLPTIIGALGSGFRTCAPGAPCGEGQAHPHGRRLLHGRGDHRLAGSSSSSCSSFSNSSRYPALLSDGGQPGRVAAGGRLRIPLRHRQLAHRGPGRLLGQAPSPA
jgi:hypothetical protein